jgi:D-3-phosphoglycerate dehydrogenase
MPKDATLINTARKEVINESELVSILEKRPDFKYGSDIAPDNAEEILSKFADQCYFTPKKMGAQTAEANINAGIAAIEQIIAFIEKGDRTFQVNK